MDRYSRPSYRPKGRYVQKSSSDLPQLLLFYILPFIVFNVLLFFVVTAVPKVTLEVADTNDYLSTEATLKIDSWFPTRSIRAAMDEEELELNKGSRRNYTISITRNGVLEVTVENLNGMSTTVYQHIDILDDVPPSFTDASLDDGLLTVHISDSQSTINFDGIYALDSTGARRVPVSMDRSAGAVTFEMDLAGLQVFIMDRAGNEAGRAFSTHQEGTLDVLEVDGGTPESEVGVVEGEGAEGGLEGGLEGSAGEGVTDAGAAGAGAENATSGTENAAAGAGNTESAGSGNAATGTGSAAGESGSGSAGTGSSGSGSSGSSSAGSSDEPDIVIE